MIDKKFNPRRYLFLLSLFIPLIHFIRPVLTIDDSIIFIFIPLFLIILLSYFPWPIPKLEVLLINFDKSVETKNTFYFIRLIGNNNYYIFCFTISIMILIRSILSRFTTLPVSLSLENMPIFYELISGSISIFLGLAFWKPVTEEFSKIVKKFSCQLKTNGTILTDIDASRATWSFFFNSILFDDLFVPVWGVFWSFLCIIWLKTPSMIERALVGFQFFVQSTTIIISALSISALFQIGFVSHIFEIDDISIYQKNFGKFFKNLGDTVMKVAVMQLLVPGFIMPTNIIVPGFWEEYSTQIKIGWFWFIFGQIFILIFGIFGAHIAMKRLKKRKKKEINKKMIEMRNRLEEKTADSISYVSTILEYNMLILQHESLESMSTWPISNKGWVGFITLLIGTIINGTNINIIRDYIIKILA